MVNLTFVLRITGIPILTFFYNSHHALRVLSENRSIVAIGKAADGKRKGRAVRFQERR